MLGWGYIEDTMIGIWTKYYSEDRRRIPKVSSEESGQASQKVVSELT